MDLNNKEDFAVYSKALTERINHIAGAKHKHIAALIKAVVQAGTEQMTLEEVQEIKSAVTVSVWSSLLLL
jgi:hypothetical protein